MAVIEEAIRLRSQQDNLAAVTEQPSLREFVTGAWPHVEGRRKLLPNWHLDAFTELLEAVSRGDVNKAVVNMPPGLAKSIVGSVMWPAWDWGPFERPDRRWLCLSYGGDDDSPATRDAERCRDLLVSRWYQGEWGTGFTLSDTQNAKNFFSNTRRGYRISTGLDGTASGQRADIVLIDDPTKMDETSLDQILKPSAIYESTLMHRAQDDGAAFVLLMSRLHPDDLAGYFLKQDGWAHLHLPMFYEADARKTIIVNGVAIAEDRRTREGEPLHAGMAIAIANANQQQRTAPAVFEAQQQQRPTLRLGAIVKRVARFTQLPPHLDEVIITVDCAFKDGEENSFVVFQKWARRHANAYLLDQLRKHMELPETCEELAAFCAIPPFATAKYVEAKANGIGVVQILRNRVPGLMTTDDDPDVLKPFCAGSKEAKLQAAAPYFNAGNVQIPTLEWLQTYGMPREGVLDWTPEYVHEITAFPRGTRFSDQVDASSMAVWKLLYTFEAHVDAADVMTPDAGNVGLVAGVFDKAYGGAETLVPANERGGFEVGGVGALANFSQRAYGRN